MRQYSMIAALFLFLGFNHASIAEIVKITDNGTFVEIGRNVAVVTDGDLTLREIYRTISTPAISGETFVCYAVNVSDHPATIKQVTIYDSEGALGAQDYDANNIAATCPFNDNDAEITLQPHQTCAVSAFIPSNRKDESSTAAHCQIKFKDENVKVKGSMEARHWVDLFSGGSVSVNSGGFWAKMRVDASE